MQQTKPYGCHNRPRKAGYYAPDRKWLKPGVFEVGLTWIPFAMSHDCRYDLKQTDQRCKGCSK